MADANERINTLDTHNNNNDSPRAQTFSWRLITIHCEIIVHDNILKYISGILFFFIYSFIFFVSRKISKSHAYLI